MGWRELTFKVPYPNDTVDTEEVDEWCFEHFGIQGENWDCCFANDSPYNYDLLYMFRRHEDAVLFTLKWA